MVTVNVMSFGYRNTFQLLDKGNIENIGPSGISYLLQNLGKQLSSAQSGFVFNYALLFTLSALFILLSATSMMLDLKQIVSITAAAPLLFSYVTLLFL